MSGLLKSRKRPIAALVLWAMFAFVFVLGGAGATSVFASGSGTQFEIDRVPVERVELTVESNADTIQPGDALQFGVNLTPHYAIDTVRSVIYRLTRGSHLASIDAFSGLLTANENATIGATITVVAAVDGVQSFNSIDITVAEIILRELTISAASNQIKQDASMQLETAFNPSNASYKSVTYKITEGASYASVSPTGLITIADNLPAGNLKIKAQATSMAYMLYSNELEFDLYVPTKNLSLSVSQASPALSETVTLFPNIDATASNKGLVYNVISGAEFIDGSISGNNLKIVDSISANNPKIMLSCSRDGLTSNTVVIEINIPVTAITLNPDNFRTTIQQGEMLELVATIDPYNASGAGLKFLLSEESKAYATIDENTGMLTARVNPLVEMATVFIVAQIGSVQSLPLAINIVIPRVVLSADNFMPTSSDTQSDSVMLTVEADEIVQATGITYNILSGAQFVDGPIVNGVLKVAKGIPNQYKNPQIRLTAIYEGYESGEIIIDITILVQEISISGTSVAQVEQQGSYLFTAHAFPLNAKLIATPLSYSVNVGSSIAYITPEGWLFITENAPIGQEIRITVDGPDGAVAMHTVTVKTVYAESIDVSKATILVDGITTYLFDQDVTETIVVRAGAEVSFDIGYSPSNVTEAEKQFTISLHSTAASNAKVVGNKVIINSGDKINMKSPNFLVRFTSVQNGVNITTERWITVYVPATKLEITAKRLSLDEGSYYTTDSILGSITSPMYADVQSASLYSIIEGNEYAYIDGAYLVVRPNLLFGNLTIRVAGYADGIRSVNEVTFNLYSKTTFVTLSVENYSPVSTISYGESVTLTTKTSNNATENNPVFTIIRGEWLIAGNYAQGAQIPRTFSIKNNVLSADKTIIIRAAQDGCPAEIELQVYVPVQSVTIDERQLQLDRGIASDFTPQFNANVNNSNWTYITYEITYPEGCWDVVDYSPEPTTPGENNSNNPIGYHPGSVRATPRPITVRIDHDLSVEIDPISGKIKIGRTTPTGTTLKVYFSSEDGFLFERTFTVKSFKREVVASFVSDVTTTDYFSLHYGYDSLNREITSALQLEVGCWVDIEIRYNGHPLSWYGITDFYLVVTSGDAEVNTSTKQDCVRLRIKDGASGKSQVFYKIVIRDGSLDTPPCVLEDMVGIRNQIINVFRPIGNNIVVKDTVISTMSKAIIAEPIDPLATANIGDLRFAPISTHGHTITDGNIFTVNPSADVFSYVVVRACYSQVYNGVTIEYFLNDIKLTFATIDLYDVSLLIKSNTISAIYEMSLNIDIPTRSGYNFSGYWTGQSYIILVIYDKRYYSNLGQVYVNNWGENAPDKLYANWTPITYEIQFAYSGLDISGAVPGATAMNGTLPNKPYVKYNETFTLKAINYDGYTFQHWLVDGREFTKSSEADFVSLTTDPTHIVTITAVYKKNECVAPGTLITLADGSQVPVELLTGDELLLVWNLHTGSFDVAPILFIDSHNGAYDDHEIIHLYFSDGTDVKVIYEHGFWDFDLNSYVFLRNDAEQYIGHWFNKQVLDERGELAWTRVQLVSVVLEMEYTTAWSPVTFSHLCYYVNGMLSMPGATEGLINIFEVDQETMQFDQEAFMRDIEEYGLFTLEDFGGAIPEIIFEAFNGQYLKVAMGKGILSFDDIYALIDRYASFFADIEDAE